MSYTSLGYSLEPPVDITHSVYCPMHEDAPGYQCFELITMGKTCLEAVAADEPTCPNCGTELEDRDQHEATECTCQDDGRWW